MPICLLPAFGVTMPLGLLMRWIKPFIIICVITIICNPLISIVDSIVVPPLNSRIKEESRTENNTTEINTQNELIKSITTFFPNEDTYAVFHETDLGMRATLPDWPMFGKDKSHSHTATIMSKGIYEPVTKWDIWPEAVTGNRIDSWASTIGNFTTNVDWYGTTERNVKHLVYAENGFINILDGSSGDYVWQLNADLIDGLQDNDLVYTTPTLGYFDGDSKLDIVFGTTDGSLYLYEPSSSYYDNTGYENSTDNVNLDKIWQYATGENFTRSSPVLEDVNDDGTLDVIVGAGNKIFANSGKTGSKLWNKTLPGNIVSTPIVYKDGTDDYVLITSYDPSSFDYFASFFTADLGLRTAEINYNLSLLPVPDQIPSPASADLDNNTANNDELVICTPFEDLGSGRVYAYHTNRSLFWSTPSNFIIGQIETTPAIYDLDGDGFNEVVVVSWNQGALGPETHIYVLHGNNGTLAWHVSKNTIGTPPYINERAVGSPIIVNVNSDNYMDIVIATSPNLYALSGESGSEIWLHSLPTGAGRSLWSTPAAGDIDNDGFLDVVLEGAAISHVIIDLTMTLDDISFSTENITENQQVTIKAIIHNFGSAIARDVKVSFFENNLLIGNSSISSIPGEDSREVRIDWFPEEDGSRTIKIIIDPDNSIEEINEDNNQISKKIDVIPSYPDLIIDAIHYYRGDGNEVDNKNIHLIEDENATVKVVLKNIGGDETENVWLRVFDTGEQLGTDEIITKLDIQQNQEIQYLWQPNRGNHDFKAIADPDDFIFEINESNNEFSEEVTVKSKQPSNPSYLCKGVVFGTDGSTPAVDIEVKFTNNRTGKHKTTTTNETGYYLTNLETLSEQYLEGDEISIFATDGENESYSSFLIYSEDRSRFDNITLIRVPTYAISISVDSGSKIIYPNSEIEYYLTVINRGNEHNTVNLSISDIVNVDTYNVASNWDAYLDEYMIEDIPPRSDYPGITLTVKAPSSQELALANDQVLIAVTAKSVYDSTQNDIVGMTTTVGRVYNFKITLDKSKVKLDPVESKEVKFNALIMNNGNDDDIININIDTKDPWSAEYNSSFDLNLGEEKELEIILRCDESVQAGNHIFNLNISSIDNQGNVSSEFVVEILRADLKFFGNMTISPALPNLNKQITLEAYILNNGTSPIPAVVINFIANDIIITSKAVYNLSGGELRFVIFNWTPIEMGEYTLELVIDPYNSIIESRKDNNKISAKINFNSDLAFSKDPVFWNDNPIEGDNVQITAFIKNVGSIEISSSFQVEFYDGDPENNGVLITIKTIDENIGGGSEKAVSIDWKAKGTGEHIIYIIVNPNRNFTEDDYDNNIVFKKLTVNPKTSVNGEVTDYSLYILALFGIAFVIIVFLILAPTKQPVKKKGKRKSTSRRGGGKRKADRGTRKAKTSAKSLKSGIKFELLDDSEPVEVAEVAEGEDDAEEGYNGDDENNLDDLDHEKRGRIISKTRRGSAKRSRSGRRKNKPISGFVKKFGDLLLGRDIDEKSSSRAEMSEDKIGRRKGTSTSQKIDSSKDKLKSTDNDEDSEDAMEVAVVEVVGEGEVDDDSDFDEDDFEDKDDKKNKGKKEDNLGWEYTQMIGIR